MKKEYLTDQSDLSILLELEKLIGTQFEYLKDFNDWWNLGGKDKQLYTVSEKKISGICINNTNLSTFPLEILELSRLEILILTNNKISTIPEEIEQLQYLRILYLDSNHITHLPESVGNLTELDSLVVNNNRIFELPESLGNLQNLKTFCCDENYLEYLPKSVINLKWLESLQLGCNKLSSLPEALGNLKNLENIDFGYNKLHSLPKSLINLKKIDFINVSNNPFVLNGNILSLFILKAIYEQDVDVRLSLSSGIPYGENPDTYKTTEDKIFTILSELKGVIELIYSVIHSNSNGESKSKLYDDLKKISFIDLYPKFYRLYELTRSLKV